MLYKLQSFTLNVYDFNRNIGNNLHNFAFCWEVITNMNACQRINILRWPRRKKVKLSLRSDFVPNGEKHNLILVNFDKVPVYYFYSVFTTELYPSFLHFLRLKCGDHLCCKTH